jgi:hypothetical protein
MLKINNFFDPRGDEHTRERVELHLIVATSLEDTFN